MRNAEQMYSLRDHAGHPFRYILASDITKRIRAAILLHPDPAYTVNDVAFRPLHTRWRRNGSPVRWR